MKDEGIAVRFHRSGAPSGVRYDVRGPVFGAEVKLKAGAFYWVRLNDPNGSSWEVAKFIGTTIEFWDYPNGRPSDLGIPYNYWLLCGFDEDVRQVQTPGASDRWEIGDIITPPTK